MCSLNQNTLNYDKAMLSQLNLKLKLVPIICKKESPGNYFCNCNLINNEFIFSTQKLYNCVFEIYLVVK